VPRLERDQPEINEISPLSALSPLVPAVNPMSNIGLDVLSERQHCSAYGGTPLDFRTRKQAEIRPQLQGVPCEVIVDLAGSLRDAFSAPHAKIIMNFVKEIVFSDSRLPR
jgi:hypothetical protein